MRLQGVQGTELGAMIDSVSQEWPRGIIQAPPATPEDSQAPAALRQPCRMSHPGLLKKFAKPGVQGSPCRGVGCPHILLLLLSPPAAASKREKKGFLGTPHTLALTVYHKFNRESKGAR